MNNYDILYKLLDCDAIVEYYIVKDGDWLNKKSMLKSEAYDFITENNYTIIDVSVSYDRQFILRVE